MFMLPLMATSILMQSYVIADGLILGNFIDEEALGSVNSVSSIIDICTLVQIAIAGGCSISASHLFGAGKYSELKRMIGDFYKIILAVSIGITILAVIGANRILELINTPSLLMDGASTYLKIVFLGVPFSSLYALQSGVLRGMGDSKRPLGGIAISSCVNIGLDLLFIVGFDMNIEGAAIATLASEVLSAIYLHVKLKNRAGQLIDDTDKPQSRVAECIELGFPQIIQSMATSLGRVLLQNITNILGASVVIGVTAAFKVDGILVIPLMCMSQATSVFTGQNIGANKPQRVTETLKLSVILSLIFSAFLTFALWMWGQQMLGWFGIGIKSGEVGYRYIMLCLPFYWLFGLQFVFNGYLNGSKHTLQASIASIIALAARVLVAYMGFRSVGSDVLPVSEAVSWAVGVVIDIGFIIFFRKKYRKKL